MSLSTSLTKFVDPIYCPVLIFIEFSSGLNWMEIMVNIYFSDELCSTVRICDELWLIVMKIGVVVKIVWWNVGNTWPEFNTRRPAATTTTIIYLYFYRIIIIITSNVHFLFNLNKIIKLIRRCRKIGEFSVIFTLYSTSIIIYLDLSFQVCKIFKDSL